MKMKKLLSLSLMLLALALPLGGCQSAPVAAPAQSPTLKVVTLNLYHDKDDWPRRRVQIAREMEQLRPDAIVLEEVLQHESLPNQAQWLAEQLGYDWHFISLDPADRPRRYGNAILTRRPILARGMQPLRPLEDSRSAGFVRIDLDGRPVNVFATHLHHTEQGGAMRAQQAADLIDYIEAKADGAPSVVAGDFNTAADSPELGRLRETFVDTFGVQHPQLQGLAASTLNPTYFKQPMRIDHVFFQRGAFQPLSSQIIFTRPDADGIWASDHHGLSVALRLLPETTP